MVVLIKRLLPSLILLAGGLFLAGTDQAQADDFVYARQFKQVKNNLRQWAEAWSKGDIQSYLDFYHPQFSPGGDVSYPQWRAQRRYRLKHNRKVRIDIQLLKLSMPGMGKRIITEFVQNYQSRQYHDRVIKQLQWQQDQGQWKIIREKIIQ